MKERKDSAVAFNVLLANLIDTFPTIKGAIDKIPKAEWQEYVEAQEGELSDMLDDIIASRARSAR